MSHLERIEEGLQGQAPKPPIERWNPPLSGEIDICIAADGGWYHEGEPIQRAALVRLFASILRRESDGHYYLVTPVEKWRIDVEDAPLMAVAMDDSASTLRLQLNTGEWVPLNSEHGLELHVSAADGEEYPYLQLWHGLDAKVGRTVYYQLAELAEPEERGDETVWFLDSGGRRHPLGRGAVSE